MEQPSTTTNGLNSVFFMNKLLGWAVGDSRTILHTADGGLTWQSQPVPSGIPNPSSASLNGITFSSSSEGWAVGSNGLILSTVNGGASWILRQSSGQTCQRVRFSNSTTGYALAVNGML